MPKKQATQHLEDDQESHFSTPVDMQENFTMKADMIYKDVQESMHKAQVLGLFTFAAYLANVYGGMKGDTIAANLRSKMIA